MHVNDGDIGERLCLRCLHLRAAGTGMPGWWWLEEKEDEAVGRRKVRETGGHGDARCCHVRFHVGRMNLI